jgi:signal transduction histidine kinase
MRAKPSSTASGIFSSFGTLTAPIPIRAAAGEPPRGEFPRAGTIHSASPARSRKPTPGVAEGQGLLHDVRNLMGALGLYSDLLSLPGVLKPEHLHYADELRLLSVRSRALMERLLDGPALDREAKLAPAIVRKTKPVSLRQVVERSSGLLSQVAGGRTIEVVYGPAASAPITAEQEDIERILVNLVRNSAAALDSAAALAGREGTSNANTVVKVVRERTADQAPEAIHIAIGVLQSRVDDPRPWPFRRVRLTVEDFGCGMTPEQLERLLRTGRAPSRDSRGIGFRVVRELVENGGGDVRVMSTPGTGTRVQIEWPVATATMDKPGHERDRRDAADDREGTA